MNNITNLRERVTTVFLKKGGSTSCTDLAQRNPELACEAKQKLGLGVNVGIILVSRSSLDEWSLITEENLIWGSRDNLHILDLREIDEAKVNFQKLKNKGTLQTADELDVLTKSGGAVSIPLEPGKGLCGFWNALIAISKINIKQSQHIEGR